MGRGKGDGLGEKHVFAGTFVPDAFISFGLFNIFHYVEAVKSITLNRRIKKNTKNPLIWPDTLTKVCVSPLLDDTSLHVRAQGCKVVAYSNIRPYHGRI
jgi:hypothetical protein